MKPEQKNNCQFGTAVKNAVTPSTTVGSQQMSEEPGLKNKKQVISCLHCLGTSREM
jgi:hypothetical protein